MVRIQIVMRVAACFLLNFYCFFQAEDGIRDLTVTGVQTCVLPISKGSALFARVSWDQALDEIAERLKVLAAQNAETILPLSYAGTMGMAQFSSMDRRFFHRLGASLLDRTLCSSAGKAGIKATLGGSVGMDPERFDEAKLILLWGANPVVSNLHLWSRVQEAMRRGAKVVAIDPYRSLSAEKCTQHLALLPGRSEEHTSELQSQSN